MCLLRPTAARDIGTLAGGQQRTTNGHCRNQSGATHAVGADRRLKPNHVPVQEHRISPDSTVHADWVEIRGPGLHFIPNNYCNRQGAISRWPLLLVWLLIQLPLLRPGRTLCDDRGRDPRRGRSARSGRTCDALLCAGQRSDADAHGSDRRRSHRRRNLRSQSSVLSDSRCATPDAACLCGSGCRRQGTRRHNAPAMAALLSYCGAGPNHSDFDVRSGFLSQGLGGNSRHDSPVSQTPNG